LYRDDATRAIAVRRRGIGRRLSDVGYLPQILAGGDIAMPTYVVLFHLTHQGLDHLRGSPDRVDAAKKTFSQHGAKVKEFYSMMGQYDSMFIVEAPNDDVMAQLALTVGAQGNVRTETHRAFNEDEYRKIVKNIP
jgi:uncharacterized protein with GYD domain